MDIKALFSRNMSHFRGKGYVSLKKQKYYSSPWPHYVGFFNTFKMKSKQLMD